MRTIIAFAAVATLGACQQQSAAPAAKSDSSGDAAAIRALEDTQAKAIAAKDVAAASGVYASDAVFIGQNGAVTRGAEAMAADFTQMLSDPGLQFEYTPGEKTFSADGSMAYATAPYTLTYTDSGTKKPVTVKGTNLSVWRKQSDGSWKLAADSNAGVITG